MLPSPLPHVLLLPVPPDAVPLPLLRYFAPPPSLVLIFYDQMDEAGLVTEILSFMQQVDFSVPAAFSAYIPPASEVAKKARSFRYPTLPDDSQRAAVL